MFGQNLEILNPKIVASTNKELRENIGMSKKDDFVKLFVKCPYWFLGLWSNSSSLEKTRAFKMFEAFNKAGRSLDFIQTNEFKVGKWVGQTANSEILITNPSTLKSTLNSATEVLHWFVNNKNGSFDFIKKVGFDEEDFQLDVELWQERFNDCPEALHNRIVVGFLRLAMASMAEEEELKGLSPEGTYWQKVHKAMVRTLPLIDSEFAGRNADDVAPNQNQEASDASDDTESQSIISGGFWKYIKNLRAAQKSQEENSNLENENPDKLSRESVSSDENAFDDEEFKDDTNAEDDDAEDDDVEDSVFIEKLNVLREKYPMLYDKVGIIDGILSSALKLFATGKPNYAYLLNFYKQNDKPFLGEPAQLLWDVFYNLIKLDTGGSSTILREYKQLFHTNQIKLSNSFKDPSGYKCSEFALRWYLTDSESLDLTSLKDFCSFSQRAYSFACSQVRPNLENDFWDKFIDKFCDCSENMLSLVSDEQYVNYYKKLQNICIWLEKYTQKEHLKYRLAKLAIWLKIYILEDARASAYDIKNSVPPRANGDLKGVFENGDLKWAYERVDKIFKEEERRRFFRIGIVSGVIFLLAVFFAIYLGIKPKFSNEVVYDYAVSDLNFRTATTAYLYDGDLKNWFKNIENQKLYPAPMPYHVDAFILQSHNDSGQVTNKVEAGRYYLASIALIYQQHQIARKQGSKYLADAETQKLILSYLTKALEKDPQSPAVFLLADYLSDRTEINNFKEKLFCQVNKDVIDDYSVLGDYKVITQKAQKIISEGLESCSNAK